MMPAHSARPAWRLGDLLAGLADPGPVPERQVSGLTLDSRTVGPGSLFLACQGRRAHGLAFAEEAARRGASAILAETSPDWPAPTLGLVRARTGIPVLGVPELATLTSALADRFYGEPSAHLEVLGVIGTQGRTRAGHLLAQALDAERPCGLVGGLGTGFTSDLKGGAPHPADPITLQATLAGLRGQGAAAVALELSPSRFRGPLTGSVRLGQALITGLAGESLDPATLSALPWAVINRDDPLQIRLLDGLESRVRIATYGLGPNSGPPPRCDLWVHARTVQAQPGGLRIRVASSLGDGLLTTGLIGYRHAGALLAVLAALLGRGLPLEVALQRLAGLRGVPGRMESVGGDGAPLVVVDHAHSPDALEKALTDLRLHGGRRVIAVVGCRGDRDRGERPLLGAIAERLSDALILTDDNPGGEDGDAILADILGGLSRPDAVRVERQRGLAIRLAIALAGTGDAVLVAGKGQENTQDLGELKVHFSDRAQVVEALREWREGHH